MKRIGMGCLGIVVVLIVFVVVVSLTQKPGGSQTGSAPAATSAPNSAPAAAVPTAPASVPAAPAVAPAPAPSEADKLLAEATANWDKDWGKVVGALEKLVKLDPANTEYKDKLYAAYLADGDKLKDAKKRDDAAKRYEAAKALDPARPEAGVKIASLYPHVGDVVSSGNWQYAVTKIETAKTITWSSFGNKSEAKGQFLVVYLNLKNQGSKNFGLNTHDFELQADGGVKYAPAVDSGVGSWLKQNKAPMVGFGATDQVPPGIETPASLLFDINPTATGLKLWLTQAKEYILLQ